MMNTTESQLTLAPGSYLLSRQGKVTSVRMHVPSTTYQDRGIFHLSCVDAQFLYDTGRIDEKDASIIAKYCFHEFLRDELHKGKDYTPGVIDFSQFHKYGELSYAPRISQILNKTYYTDPSFSESDIARFDYLDTLWYDFLSQMYVKISVFEHSVEFRICSNDNFDWNSAIIDDVLLTYEFPYNTKFTILKSYGTTFLAYFMNASLSEILETDHVVLSTTQLTRMQNRKGVTYESVK